MKVRMSRSLHNRLKLTRPTSIFLRGGARPPCFFVERFLCWATRGRIGVIVLVDSNDWMEASPSHVTTSTQNRSFVLLRFSQNNSASTMGFLRGTYAQAVALFVVLASQSSCAFSVIPPSYKTPASSSSSTTTTTQLGLFNAFNEGKKALVRKLAGDYDQGAVRARLDSLIADNPVLFLSFET